MAKRIILSADSTCDLSPQLKERFDVHYYPFHVIFRGVDYLDNVTLTPEEMYAGYYEDGSLPQTAAINEAEYAAYFKPFVEAGCEVIHFNLGAALSSAHSHCRAAAAKLPGVYAIDSRNLSTGIGLQIIHAAKLIDQGLGAAEVVRCVEGMRSRVHSSFILSTLDFMAAGGRCPSVLALATNMLKIKPEILVNNADGSMGIGKIYRGQASKVYERYIRATLAKYPDIVADHIFVTSTGVPDDVCAHMVEVVRDCIPSVAEVHTTCASCCISSHCGPGTLGVLFVTEG